jgi:hypothetical protein
MRQEIHKGPALPMTGAQEMSASASVQLCDLSYQSLSFLTCKMGIKIPISLSCSET